MAELFGCHSVNVATACDGGAALQIGARAFSEAALKA